MIRLNILKLLDDLHAQKGRKYTLKEVSAGSGCDKNALSRLVNHPDVVPSARVIDQLVQYFFFELTRDEERPHLDKNRIKKVITNFITVYPDNEEFWSVLPPEIRNNPDSIPLDAIWSVYTRLKAPEREKPSVKQKEIESSLKAKILEADAGKQEGVEIELTFTPEEFELLRENLPQKLGGKG
ncbi:MAG: hypothetical protein ACOX2O_08700 [Bdellovibrionota bacterium]|jgi:hypothetical protein